MVDKIDSNATGLRYALETSPKVVGGGGTIWYSLEPNSYDSFGPDYNKIARRPIGPSRQRRKGVTAGMEASGGFNQDLTFSNLTRILQGFFFATAREELTTKSLNSAQVSVTAIATSDDSYSVASGMPAFLDNNLIYVRGATNAANNGLHVVAGAATGTKVAVGDNLVDETPAANAVTIERVGHKFVSSTVDVVMNGNFPVLTRMSGGFNFTTLGLIPGEWVFIGGDSALSAFTNNVGFGRVASVTASTIQFDKTTFNPTAEVGTSLELRIFFGNILKNESDPSLIITRSYQLERTLGADNVGTQSEYLTGSFCNEITINIPEEDKVNLDLSFVALGHEKRTGTTGLKAGTRPTLALEEAYNTTIDTTRFRMAIVNPNNPVHTPLFNYASEATISLTNNVSMNKALTVFGGFNATAGLFEVGGDVTAYFTTTDALQSIENNDSVGLDVWIQRDNQAIMFDLPMIQVGDGQLDVAIDEPVMLPISNEAVESPYGSTLLFQWFSWLPTLASM